MTQKRIIELAKASGFQTAWHGTQENPVEEVCFEDFVIITHNLEAFYKAVRNETLEEAAKAIRSLKNET